MKVSLWISIIVLVLFSSCASFRVSNPGQAKYTNHHGRSMSKRLNHESVSEKGSENDSSYTENRTKQAKISEQKKKRNFHRDMQAAIWTWIAVSLITLGLFIAAIWLGWGTLALIPIVIVGGFVWLINIAVILALVVSAL